MELLLISKNKIRISLTKEDLADYRITCDKMDYDNTETRRVFWCLFDEVKQKTGFDAAESRIFIQIYPDKSGGCELYVSKINEPANAENVHGRSKVSCDTCSCDPPHTHEIYVLEGTKTLIAACRQLMLLGYEGRSSAYADTGETFYLSIEPRTRETYVLAEYGSRGPSRISEAYIKEHCKTVCNERAVQTLGIL